MTGPEVYILCNKENRPATFEELAILFRHYVCSTATDEMLMELKRIELLRLTCIGVYGDKINKSESNRGAILEKLSIITGMAKPNLYKPGWLNSNRTKYLNYKRV